MGAALTFGSVIGKQLSGDAQLDKVFAEVVGARQA